MYILKRISGFILLAALVCACSTKPNEAVEEEAGDLYKGDKQAICLGNNVSVRNAPATTGDLLTAISIGESVAYLDSVVVDTVSKGKYEYALIRLSDGTEGWAVKSYLFKDTQLLAITAEATIYSRPDLLTATKKSFKPMDLFVITSSGLVNSQSDMDAQEADWLPVTGRVQGTKSFTTGWIKGGNATSEQSDVLVAQLVYKANELKDNRMEELNNIILDGAYSGSVFINNIRELTYNDPNGLLKEENEKYFVGMINYYDSSGHDYFYQFMEVGPSVKIFGKTFYSFLVSENCGYCQYNFPWYLFYMFSTYTAAEKGFENSGYYNTSFEIEDRLAAMEKLAGMPVYSRTTDRYLDFDRVNPKFVNWVANSLIPHPENDFLGTSAQNVYDVVFKNNARDIWSQWRLMDYEFDMEAMANHYEDDMELEGFEGYEYLQGQFDQTNINTVLAGSFIRRRIDGSYDEVVNLMQKIMALYDGQWIAEQLETEPYLEYYYDEEDVYDPEFDAEVAEEENEE